MAQLRAPAIRAVAPARAACAGGVRADAPASASARKALAQRFGALLAESAF